MNAFNTIQLGTNKMVLLNVFFFFTHPSYDLLQHKFVIHVWVSVCTATLQRRTSLLLFKSHSSLLKKSRLVL